jgi:uncharacterized protein
MALPPPAPGSTCLVTGASSGIGADLARSLARRGHGAVLVARRSERLEELAEELREEHGVRAETISCDLADPAARDRLGGQIDDLGLTVEVLVNNAGFGSGGLFQTLDHARELEMVRLNVEAVVALCARYVPAMVDRGQGAVLNVASIAAYQPLPYQATYSATKAFVLTFSEALSADLHGTGVQVTALCPGPVPTEFGQNAGIDDGEWEGIPGFVLTSPEHNAAAAVSGMEKGRRVVVPGPLNQVTSVAGHFTPRSVLLGLVRRFYPVGR